MMIQGCFILSCDNYSKSYQEREARALKDSEEIVIGIVDTRKMGSNFLEGVGQAIKEINDEGGLLGRTLRPIYVDDGGNVEQGMKVAKEFSANRDVIAVIGHRFSSVALSTSITYEQSGIIFISYGATAPDLARDTNQFVFRNIPSDEEIGREIAAIASQKGYTDVIIIYDRANASKRMGEIFYEHASNRGITIIALKSYSSWQNDFRLLIADIIKEFEFDAIFLAGGIPAGAELIRQMRDMGLEKPVLGTNYLDSPELWNIAGKSSEGTIVATVFDPDMPRTLTRNFVKTFKRKYGYYPDTWAAQGYDAVRVLAHAIEKSGSTVPIVLSTTLKFLTDWEGVTGNYSFTRDGNIKNKELFFKQVISGNFEFLDKEIKGAINPYECVEDITLRIPVEGRVQTIDPGLTFDTTSIEIVEQLFLGLMDLKPETYEPEYELAKEWTVSEDGKTYHFKMRQDALWTDVKPVTAHDVVWAVQRNIRPETKCPNAPMLYVLKNAKDIHEGKITDINQLGVRAEDSFTVVFELEHPAAYFPSMVGLWVFRPLPGDTIIKYGDQWTEPKNIQCSGSYKLAAWEKGMVMILRKNPVYYDQQNVSIPEIRYYIVPESSVGLAMYKNNQVDLMGGSYLRIPMDQITNIKNNYQLSQEFYHVPSLCTYAFAFNTRKPPVDNVLVRKAIAAAINRKMLIQIVTKSNHQAATTFTNPSLLGGAYEMDADNIGIGIRFNPVQAAEWLAEAGYPNGEGFPKIRLIYNMSETHKKIAEAIQTFLQYYLNIDVELEAQTWEKYIQSRTEHLDGHMVRFGWCADYPDANNWLNELFNPKRSTNIIGWENEQYEMLMDRAQKQTHDGSRKGLYRQAEKILCEEMCAVVPIFFESGDYLVKPRVKGWYPMTIGGQHIRDWYLE